MPERLPPHNIEAEQSVLGSLLIAPEALAVVMPTLKATDFYRQTHGAIYSAMCQLYSQGAKQDMVVIADEMERAGTLGGAGGMAYITDLLSNVPTYLHVEEYARIVKRCAMQRRLIDTATRIAKLAYDEQEPRDIIEQTQASLSALLAEKPEDNYSWSHLETLSYTRELIDKLARQWHEAKVPYPTIPWPGVAQFVPWLRPGLPAVLAAPTGVGKTLLCENLAEAWAEEGWHVVYFHYELPIETIIARRFARHTGVMVPAFEKGLYTIPRGPELMAQVEAKVRSWPGSIQYVHCEGWPIRRVVSEAEALWRQQLCDVFIVDYLSKAPFVSTVKGETTAQMVGRDVNLLKDFCERRRVCALLVSQYNNQGTLRNSGEIEQLVNVVLKVDKVSPDRLKVTVDKNTLGACGQCQLVVDFSRYLVKE